MIPRCESQAAGRVDLYFYGELAEIDQAEMQAHLKRCAECRRALNDLSAITAALAAGEEVSAPPAGEWSGFMARLDSRLLSEPDGIRARRPYRQGLVPSRRWAVAGLAVAAALVVVTIAVLAVVGDRQRLTPHPAAIETAFPDRIPTADGDRPDAALASLSRQHFARSKLVVLGLATRDAAVGGDGDWAYEWGLASSLLSDTRLYRIAAEERGMASLAGVMRDLELVLLEASMSREPDQAGLEQVQRLIRRRDLVTKMNAAYTAD